MVTNTVKIGGQTFKVTRPDECTTENRNCDGQIIYGKGIIELRNDLKGDYLEYVFLHEIFHGIYEHCGFQQNENEVDRLARALYMVIKDNPDIFKGGETDGKLPDM